jgi:MtrB/PioB family decaheme-associated outer membrane protein
MTKNIKAAFRMTALAAALCAAYGTPLADEVRAEVAVGVGNWSNDRLQRGMFDGMREDGAYLLLDGSYLRRNDATGTWLGFNTRNLGLDSRELGARWERQGDIGISLDYSRIPRDHYLEINSGVVGLGTTRQIVPTPSIVPGTGSNVELGTVRDRYTVKFFKRLTEGLNFTASFRNEEKDGTRHWGRGGAPEFAVEPIDYRIRIFEAALTYSRGPLQVSGGYYGTSFDNANGLVITSLSSLAAASFYNLTLPLDNHSHELFVHGGYDFTPTTRGSFKASYSTAKQNEFLPTAAAGLIFPAGQAPIAGAPTHLDGQLDTTIAEIGLTSSPIRNLSILANLRYRDLKDKTPLVMVASAGGGVWNTPWSYKNTIGKLEATYRFLQGYSLQGGIEYNTQDRWVPTLGTLYVPFRAKLDETTYRVQLRKAMSESINGTIGYAYSKRDGGTYTLPGDPFEDLINPLNIADRERDKWRAMVDWSPVDRFSLQFTFEDSRDEYSGMPFGPRDGNARLYSLDASYQLNSDWNVTAWVSRDETEAHSTGQRATGAGVLDATKDNRLSEDGTSFGAGFRGKVFGRVKLGGDLEWFRSVSEYRQNVALIGAATLFPVAGGVTMVPPPDITNKLLRVKLFAAYAIQKNADIRVDLIHERWRTDDWSWSLFPATGRTPFTYGTATDGTTVTLNPKQNSTFAGIRYIYRFE